MAPIKTYKKPLTLRCFAYFDGEYYTAVCLELGIVEQYKESLEKALFMLDKAIDGYLKVVKKHDYPDELLYRPAEKRYWRKYEQLLNQNLKAPETKIPSLPLIHLYNHPIPAYA